MSSCDASCYICCPKALSAFATSASWPTGGAPLSCRFAFNYSEPYRHRRPNQKPPLPRNRAHFGSVPNVAAAWWSSRDLPLPRSNSVLRPLPPESPHDPTIPSPLPGASHHLPPWCALLAPKPVPHFKPRLELSPQPHANYHHTNPACPLVNSTPSSPEPFSSPQHHSICISASPRTASFKQLYRTRPPRRPEPTCAHAMGRIRYSTSVSWIASGWTTLPELLKRLPPAV